LAVLIHASFVALALASCATTPSKPASVIGGILFVHRAPLARTVSVVGSFNGWEPAAMRSNGDGSFQGILHVSPGSHRFAYRVVRSDGTVATEPPTSAPRYEDDGFGSKNGVLDIAGIEALPGNPRAAASSLKVGSD
jgi:1,4-alpha-glucan branching enzyme